MKGISFIFFAVAVVCAVVGMSWGLHMAISGDHLMAPAHAHLNLVGWVTLSIFGFYYHLVPAAAERTLAKVHLVLAIGAAVIMPPGIAIAVSGGGEPLAAIGSILALASMLTFLFIVLTTPRG